MPSSLPDVAAAIGPLVQAVPSAVRPRLMATLERAAGDRYDAWAAVSDDAALAGGLRACAAREREVASRAEALFAAAPDERTHIGSAVPGIVAAYASAMANRPMSEQLAIQAAAERRGAEFWRAVAAAMRDARVGEGLEACAVLEEENARFLESVIARAT